jgi:hypothetical protein
MLNQREHSLPRCMAKWEGTERKDHAKNILEGHREDAQSIRKQYREVGIRVEIEMKKHLTLGEEIIETAQ